MLTARHKPIAAFAAVLTLVTYLLPASVNAQAAGTDLLTSPWKLSGNNGASEKYTTVPGSSLKGFETLRLTFDLKGACLYGGDASALVFDQPQGDWRFASLDKYAKNCHSGTQTVDIPLSDFSNLDTNQPVGLFHVRFWQPSVFGIDVIQARLVTSGSADTSIPTPAPQNPQGFLAQYWNTSDFSNIPTRSADFSQTETNLSHDWQYGSPSPKINSDNFIARWTKTSNYEAGEYEYTVVSDDGVRLFVDGQKVFDNWSDHPVTTNQGRLQLSGDRQIRLEYYERGGHAVAKFDLKKVDTPQPLPTNPPANNRTWEIQSVSSMKQTKDKVCSPDSREFVENWVDKAKELGANYIAVETPYDNPSCGNAQAMTKTWVDVIRSRGLKVWHRHMFLGFEGIYDTQKDNRSDYLSRIASYIKANPSYFASGDIFTPAPEPQNGGISGFSYCAQGVCMFDSVSHFNRWLRDAIDVSNQAFAHIGLGGQIKTGYYGFDGFVAWGSNNPDWNGILEDATVQKMGNITIDHYPELIGQTMKQGLDELQARYPNVPIIIGEWGSVADGDKEAQVRDSMSAAIRPNIVGFNYWHMGMGGNESLIDGNFQNNPQFDEVQAFFQGRRP